MTLTTQGVVAFLVGVIIGHAIGWTRGRADVLDIIRGRRRW